MPERCGCCHHILSAPAPTCVCGHPMGSHHRSERGNVLYCTVWDGPKGQCPCKKGEQR